MSHKKRTDSVDSFYMKCSSKTLFNRMECVLRESKSSLSIDPQMYEEYKTVTARKINNSFNEMKIVSNLSNDAKDKVNKTDQDGDAHNISCLDKDVYLTESTASLVRDLGMDEDSESSYDCQSLENDNGSVGDSDLDKLTSTNSFLNKEQPKTKLVDEEYDYEISAKIVSKEKPYKDHSYRKKPDKELVSDITSEKTLIGNIPKVKKKTCKYKMVDFRFHPNAAADTRNMSTNLTNNNDLEKKHMNVMNIKKSKDEIKKNPNSVQKPEIKKTYLKKGKVTSTDKIDKRKDIKPVLFTDKENQNTFKRQIALDYDKKMREKRKVLQERKFLSKIKKKSLTTLSGCFSEPLETFSNFTYSNTTNPKKQFEDLLYMPHNYVSGLENKKLEPLFEINISDRIKEFSNHLQEQDLVREPSLEIIEIKESSSVSNIDEDNENVLNDHIHKDAIVVEGVPFIEEQISSTNESISLQSVDTLPDVVTSEQFSEGEFFTLVQNNDGSLSVQEENLSPVDIRVQEFKSAYKQLHTAVLDRQSGSMPLQTNIQLPFLETSPSKKDNVSELNEANILISNSLLNVDDNLTIGKDISILKSPGQKLDNTKKLTPLGESLENKLVKYTDSMDVRKYTTNNKPKKVDITFQGNGATYQVVLQGNSVSCKVNQALKETTTSSTTKLVEKLRSSNKATKTTVTTQTTVREAKQETIILENSIDDNVSVPNITVNSKPAVLNLSAHLTKSDITNCFERAPPTRVRLIAKGSAFRSSLKRRNKQKKLNNEKNHLLKHVLMGYLRQMIVKLQIPSQEALKDLFLFFVYFATFSLIFGALRLGPPVCDFKQTL